MHRRPRWWLFAGLLLAAQAALVGCPGATTPDTVTTPSDPPAPGYFEDMTRASGVNFVYRNGEEANHMAILESLGGGVALLDFDGDGLLDIFLPGGGYFTKKFEDYVEFKDG